MALIENWVRRPQGIWLRKALFQIHMWTGIGVGLYVLMISITGAAVVYRNEIYNAIGNGTKFVTVTDHRLTHDELKAAVQKAYPSYAVQWIFDGTKLNEATDIWMEHGGSQKKRLFDPYTGKDLGNSIPFELTIIAWMYDFHKNLLAGDTGRLINGIGAIFVTLLGITGMIIWWPGIQNWRRSLTIPRTTNWKRFNWGLHSATGIWSLAFVLLWGITGIYLVFPRPFEQAVNFFTPVTQFRGQLPAELGAQGNPDAGVTRITDKDGNVRIIFHIGEAQGPQPLGDRIVRYFTAVHFGNFAGKTVKAIWVFFGLMPAILFITGSLMWWNRVLSPAFRRTSVAEARFHEAATSD
jgi:uncharacterized iron-regulated membrane protein